MAAVSTMIALLLGALILAGAVHDTVRLVAPRASRHRGERATLEVTERRYTALLLRGRITPAEYRARMSHLAHCEHGRPSGN